MSTAIPVYTRNSTVQVSARGQRCGRAVISFLGREAITKLRLCVKRGPCGKCLSKGTVEGSQGASPVETNQWGREWEELIELIMLTPTRSRTAASNRKTITVLPSRVRCRGRSARHTPKPHRLFSASYTGGNAQESRQNRTSLGLGACSLQRSTRTLRPCSDSHSFPSVGVS